MESQVHSPCIGTTDGKEEYEPPILGCSNTENSISLTPDKSEDTIMDEMMKEGSRALARNREKIAHKRRQESKSSFGAGLQKGFLSSGSVTLKKVTPVSSKRESLVDSTFSDQAKSLIVRSPSKINQQEAAKDNSFVFPEVQKVMNELGNNNNNDWMNGALMERLSSEPELCEAMQNREFMEAITEFQNDPKKSIEKYKNNPKLGCMLQKFIAFLGDHFEQVAEEMEKKNTIIPSVPPPATENVSRVVDLDEARLDAIRNMPHEPEEEAQIQSILNNQQLMNALADEKFMRVLQSCQNSSSGLQALARDANFGPKLRLLLENNMVQLQ
uniref:Plectinlike protein putative n=1 Tax=Albugo laibachii Nc14 TaxID=890382 RepID=F0WAV8_9STRA|nr:plectinlike protein putative [Albugo laibachii Nc14]CCA18446.1 plectinlike protein putative [Albugo laibachii Nc14]|eukprot:CCA18446.1 plectinlike protein putative [Albugo laibachii Nc14]